MFLKKFVKKILHRNCK